MYVDPLLLIDPVAGIMAWTACLSFWTQMVTKCSEGKGELESGIVVKFVVL